MQKCPRCLVNDLGEYPALSRSDNEIKVCGECGTWEAMYQFSHDGALPPISDGRKMSLQEHKVRHQTLHRALDELLADFITKTGKRPSESTIMELVTWSHQQTINPVE